MLYFRIVRLFADVNPKGYPYNERVGKGWCKVRGRVREGARGGLWARLGEGWGVGGGHVWGSGGEGKVRGLLRDGYGRLRGGLGESWGG